MNILIVDQDHCGLPFAMRCQAAKHSVRLWMPPEKGGRKSRIGEGIVQRVDNFKSNMTWADLVVMTDNSRFRDDMEPFFRRGFPIFGCNKAAGDWELDRAVGQKVFEEHGMEVLPFKTFSSYDKAIAYVKKEGRPFVSKPWGGNPDKSMSYVPKTEEDLISMLQAWKRQGIKGEFMLQEMVEGFEMAVGAWIGPGGFAKPINENWEEKRMLNEGLGPNTGEMGTVMRYVRKSKMFEDVLAPLEQALIDVGYVGYVDVNCIVGKDGTPWPLEFTMRFGWPHFNLCMALHEGDPANWMADLLEGKDSLKVSSDVCLGVVMAMGDYPWNNFPPERIEGHPIRGLTKKVSAKTYLSSVMMGEAPVKVGGSVEDRPCIVSAGAYVLVATGTGSTVTDAYEDAYDTVESINWPPHKTYRTDIGMRLEDDLPALQKFGYATGMEF